MEIPNKNNVITTSDGYEVIVDEADYKKFNAWKWRISEFGYAKRTFNCKRSIYLHKEIMNCEPGQLIDHINRNKLDNRKSNLRLCTVQQNNQNRGKNSNKKSSLFKGVHFEKRKNHIKRWYVKIGSKEKNYTSKCFMTELEAKNHYDKKALELFGEFAYTNERSIV